MNMKRIVFFFDVSVCGIGGAVHAEEYPDDVMERELNNDAWSIAVDNAAAYGYYPMYEYEDEPDFDPEDEQYTQDIDGWWEEYIPEKHDQQKPGGGKWFD